MESLVYDSVCVSLCGRPVQQVSTVTGSSSSSTACRQHSLLLQSSSDRYTPAMTAKEYCRMGSLDEVPFQVPLGSLEEPLDGMNLATAPEINIPDYHQILKDTQYEFSLENWVLTELHAGSFKDPGVPVCSPEDMCAVPSCPPYWLLFSSPQVRHTTRHRSKELREDGPRPRSLSMSAVVDPQRRRLPRSVHFLMADSECEGAGYREDDEGSSSEDDAPASRSHSAERPRSSGPKRPPSLLWEAQRRSASQLMLPGSPRLPSAKTKKSSTGSPHSQRSSRRKAGSGSSSAKRHSFSHKQTTTQSLLQQRPSSAGPQPSTRLHKPALQTLRPRSSHGGRGSGTDSSVELLYALSKEERELLETITAQGYTPNSAILALQRTGPRSPEQILNYLLACDRLCALGYEKSQVEDALEMFQNCESKAAEFLCLLAQFREMGFQQSTIKEVLLLHENHRERALEELMTRVA
ncbi:ubiquitin-associated protein 1-like [Pygocentrus nattereri]|uniref:Ubiquitin-associated protein 1-like UBA2 domain-containing protein n=1 Tax=Pygocentrus nattereri TaxID=42514 RepID=A0A3B4DF77_PYGNA|nr:ubiquitin-associated protein 1-like [Pygocentrus nattereri]